MNTSEKILNGIKQALTEGKATVNFTDNNKTKDVEEASTLTGSGLNIGGRVYFDDAFAALRYANPFRMGSRQVTYTGSAAQFVAKTGNAANSTNPWLYVVTRPCVLALFFARWRKNVNLAVMKQELRRLF